MEKYICKEEIIDRIWHTNSELIKYIKSIISDIDNHEYELNEYDVVEMNTKKSIDGVPLFLYAELISLVYADWNYYASFNYKTNRLAITKTYIK